MQERKGQDMDYRFIRRLMDTDCVEIQQAVVTALEQAGIEVFVRGEEKGTFVNLLGEAAVKGGELFVSGADLEKSTEITEALGYGSLIAKEPVLQEMKSELEKAQEAYDKKRKWMYIECLVVVGIAVAVLLLKAVF